MNDEARIQGTGGQHEGPGDGLTEVSRSHRPKRLRDHGLVLQSMGIPYQAVQAAAEPVGESELRALVDDLRRLAGRYLQHEAAGHTLQPTALVNEAFLRLLSGEPGPWTRGRFYAVAAVAMRRILINHARDKRRLKRGGGGLRIPLELAESDPEVDEAVDVVALDEALTRLARNDPRKARLVELRFFAGLSLEEACDTLGISPATAKRDWSFARAWLARDLERGPE